MVGYRLFHQLLDVLGLKVCTLADIGARGGVDNRWRLLGEHLVVIGFEPDQEEYAKLTSSAEGGRWVFLPIALANYAGKAELYIRRNGGSSSYYVPNDLFLNRFPQAERFDVLAEKREVTVDTLDNILTARGDQTVDFIKLDTEGFEKRILEGARKKAGQAFGLEVEIQFSELYKGQPLFSDVDVLIRDLGFSLFDLRPCYWKRTARSCKGIGQMVFADALYFKDPIAMDLIPRNPAAAVAICTLYRKFDYAMELARFFCDKAVYSSYDYDRIQAVLLRISTPGLFWGKVKGGMRVANFLESITSGLKGASWFRYDGWKF